MVAILSEHNSTWLAPQPLWYENRSTRAWPQNTGFGTPAILRFDNDLFMEELLALLAHHPERLGEWVAQPETWRRPMATPPTAAQLNVTAPISRRSLEIARTVTASAKSEPTPAAAVSAGDDEETLPLKLYQPSQQRYYLIAASLVCRHRGLPDRVVNAGNQEKAAFVLRRLRSEELSATGPCNPEDATCHEYAYVKTANGFVWKKLPPNARRTLQSKEERLPLFALTYDQQPHARRLLAGMIPVGKREAYLGAPETDAADAGGNEKQAVEITTDPRRLLFEAQVTAPWKSLVEQAHTVELEMLRDPDPAPTSDDNGVMDSNFADRMKITREQIQTGSWYVLLDLAKYLKTHLNCVWRKIRGDTPDRALSSVENKLAAALQSVTIPSGSDLYYLINTSALAQYQVKTSLPDALKSVLDHETKLEAVQVPFNCRTAPETAPHQWPGFLFPLANPAVKLQGSPRTVVADNDLAVPVPLTDASVSGLSGVDVKTAHIDELADMVEACLEEDTAPSPAEIEQPHVPEDQRETWFVIRCVYERPNCGPLNPPVVSAPSAPFLLAPFFDPDAPARPIRIPMPMDISPAGLRKFKKNATFMLSDMLCGKIKGIRKLTLGDLVLSVLPWPFHKSLPDISDTGPCEKGAGNSIGMFCSLSIPIVTLCALILLIIIVQLFDTIFRWMPYLFICFPVPGFKGKKE